MLAVVKTPRIEIRAEGEISPGLLHILKLEFGKKLHIEKDDDEKLVNVKDSDWWKEMQSKKKPGDVMRVRRTLKKWTQEYLGKELGFEKQYVNDLESGRRGISKNVAKKLSEIFEISAERFL